MNEGYFVRVVSCTNARDFEISVDKCLGTYNKYKLVDIKYSTHFDDCSRDSVYSALIIFEERGDVIDE